MDERGFGEFLRKGGRSPSAVKRCLAYVGEFEAYLGAERAGPELDQVSSEDLESFVAWVEREPKSSAKGHLWGLRYYYQFTSNEDMAALAGVLREQRIERTPFPLKDFRGVDVDYVNKLADAGIRNVEQMLDAGRTPADRGALAAQTGVSLDAVLEFVKLSDLARIPGVKGIRARLYHDAGVDTLEKIAGWEPEAFRAMIVEFVERTDFDGVPTLPAEARFTIERAKELPKIVEY